MAKLGIFAFETPEKCLINLVGVPWEVTTSYLSGTSKGPKAIFEASGQVDLFDLEITGIIESGIKLTNGPSWIAQANRKLKPIAKRIIKKREEQEFLTMAEQKNIKKINTTAAELQEWLAEYTEKVIDNEQIIGVIGGDHSTPLGAIEALSKKYPLGVLHFDAHHDLRDSYQGFTQSHASIMNNVLKLSPSPVKLVQVGIRDFSVEEYDQAKRDNRINTFYDRWLKAEMYRGQPWAKLCDQIVASLPEHVYISFDIDGLNPIYCPSTGTPVPGGLDFSEARHLLMALVRAKKKIVGFDLVEVAPSTSSEYDGNVAARLLYLLCGCALASRKPSALKDLTAPK